MELPVYELLINQDNDSELSVEAIALVDRPAIEKNFLKFNAEKQAFAIDDDRRIISGLAMRANQLIYRKDAQYGEYQVVFSADTIEQIAQKFFSLGYNNNFNIMHDPNMKCNGVTVFESFIVDSRRGIQPMAGFEDAKQGDWFISAHVKNDAVWATIKDGSIKGFSVEGLFAYKREPVAEILGKDELSLIEQIENLLKNKK